MTAWARLEISAAAYDEIRDKLRAAQYPTPVDIPMDGIRVSRRPETTPAEWDEYALARSRQAVHSMQMGRDSQRVSMVQQAIIDALRHFIRDRSR